MKKGSVNWNKINNNNLLPIVPSSSLSLSVSFSNAKGY